MLKKVINSCLNGINGTVFMYGQTGSGKTFTMMGYDQKDGLYNKTAVNKTNNMKNKKSWSNLSAKNNYQFQQDFDTKSQNSHMPRPQDDYNDNLTLENKTGALISAFKEIFDQIEKNQDKTHFVKCSYIEIYNDNVYDLLQKTENLGETLQVCEDANKESFFIRGVREESVDSFEEIIEKLKRGEINRHYARTLMNHSSSRSHAIFRIYVQAVASPWLRGERATEGAALVTESWLNFVDLAGSERVSSHDKLDEGIKSKERIKEGQHINKSLFFLTQVIKLKSEGKNNVHIPYRNSPLTKILRSSLGGNSRTVVILCVNPTFSHLEQTLSTIRFGISAKKIENNVLPNIVTNSDGEAVRILLSDYEKKLRDSERERDIMKNREKYLVNKLQEFDKLQKIILLRLKMTQEKLGKKITNCLSEDDLTRTLEAVTKSDSIHFDNVGILNSNTRYEGFRSILWGKNIEMLKEHLPELLGRESEALVRCNFDSEGKYCLQFIAHLKEKYNLDLELIKKIEENVVGFDEELEILGYKAKALHNLCENNINKLAELVILCREEF